MLWCTPSIYTCRSSVSLDKVTNIPKATFPDYTLHFYYCTAHVYPITNISVLFLRPDDTENSTLITTGMKQMSSLSFHHRPDYSRNFYAVPCCI